MLNDPLIIDILSIYFFSLKVLAPLIALLILISSIDDFIIDIIYFLRHIYRQLFIYNRYPRYSAADIEPKEERPIAIMIPAWREADVIGKMLERLIANYNYENYLVFIGVYPNDPDTLSEIRALKRRNAKARKHICIVSTKKPGPTSKAQCLNQVYAYIQRLNVEERAHNRIYVIHDAEDIVHPLEPWVFNHLMPEKAMVQIPVQPIYREGIDMVGGHYADEFAESHRRDMVVRETLTKGVPSAGVGCAFSDEALARAAAIRPAGPFNENSLTEDYDLALLIRSQGLPQAFVHLTYKLQNDQRTHCICSKALFPDSFDAAIRQKTRWLIGIVFQGSEEFGWQGSLLQRYMFLRDRKALLTAPLNAAAYFLLINIIFISAAPYFWPEFPSFGALVEETPLLGIILCLNVGFLFHRAIQRVWHVSRIHGMTQGLKSLLRIPAANIINFIATFRAMRQYRDARGNGKRLEWDKTSHSFPTDSQVTSALPVAGE